MMNEFLEKVVHDLHKDKVPYQEIADQTGLTLEEITSVIVQPQETKLTSSLSEKVLEDYRKDKALNVIASTHKVAVSTIYKILSDSNEPLRKATYKSAKQLREETAIKMYQANSTYAEIQAETGYANGTVTAIMRRNKIPLRNAK